MSYIICIYTGLYASSICTDSVYGLRVQMPCTRWTRTASVYRCRVRFVREQSACTDAVNGLYANSQCAPMSCRPYVLYASSQRLQISCTVCTRTGSVQMSCRVVREQPARTDAAHTTPMSESTPGCTPAASMCACCLCPAKRPWHEP